MKVKKEVTVAIVIGLIIALVVTGGILRARTALSKIKIPSKDAQQNRPVESGKIERKSNELFVDLTTPDNSVTTEPKLTLTGKTLPGTYIAILAEKGEYLIVPSDAGTFSQDIVLIKGANTITVTVYQNDGKKVEKTLSAVYTTAQL
jgi:hypothetical protein